MFREDITKHLHSPPLTPQLNTSLSHLTLPQVTLACTNREVGRLRPATDLRPKANQNNEEQGGREGEGGSEKQETYSLPIH
jgi:hypothetical protein